MDELKSSIRDLEIKKSMINDLENEKEQLQKELLSTSIFIDQVVKKTKCNYLIITKNYELLWNKHQNKLKELEQTKNLKECLKVSLDDLIKNDEKINNQLQKSYERNKTLEETINKMNKSLKNQQGVIACLKEENEQLTKRSGQVTVMTEALKVEKEKYRKLKLNFESFQYKVMDEEEKSKQRELESSKNIDTLKKQMKLQKDRIAELNESLCRKESYLHELKETLDRYNDKFEELKQKSEIYKTLANESSDKLQERKCAEKDREEKQEELNKRSEELEKLCKQNKQLNVKINELQHKLDLASKKSDVNEEKLVNDLTKKMCEEIAQMKNELILKSQTIMTLEERIAEVIKMRKNEAKNAEDMKAKLDELEKKRVTTPPAERDCCENSNNDSSRSPPLPVSFEQVRKKLQTEKCQATCTKRSDCMDDGLENKNTFEKLIENATSVAECISSNQ